MVLEATNVPAYLRQRRESLAVRIPDDETLRQLLSQTGPLMTTSANAPGEPTATTIASARNYFGSTVDFYVDNIVINEIEDKSVRSDELQLHNKISKEVELVFVCEDAFEINDNNIWLPDSLWDEL